MFVPGVMAMVVGVVTSYAIQYGLGYDSGELQANLFFRIGGGMDTVRWQDYLRRQHEYLQGNLGDTAIFLSVAMGMYLILSRAIFANFLLVCSVILCVTTVIWVAVFRNASYIHSYNQWYFVPAFILLLGGFLAFLRGQHFSKSKLVKWGFPSLLVPLLIMVSMDTYQRFENREKEFFGTRDDMLAIRSFDRRLIVFSEHTGKERAYWGSRTVQLYTDPIFRGSKTVGMKLADQVDALRPGQDVLVMPSEPAEGTDFERICGRRFGVAELHLLRKTPNFCFYDFELSEDAGDSEAGTAHAAEPHGAGISNGASLPADSDRS
jgi:hypothetical protein